MSDFRRRSQLTGPLRSISSRCCSRPLPFLLRRLFGGGRNVSLVPACVVRLYVFLIPCVSDGDSQTERREEDASVPNWNYFGDSKSVWRACAFHPRRHRHFAHGRRKTYTGASTRLSISREPCLVTDSSPTSPLHPAAECSSSPTQPPLVYAQQSGRSFRSGHPSKTDIRSLLLQKHCLQVRVRAKLNVDFLT